MTGVWVVAAAVVLVVAFGGYRRLTDGRARRVVGSARPRLDATRLGEDLGSAATLVQFSSTVCAPCRVTRRMLAEVVQEEPTVAHVEVDVEERLDLVEQFGITRTPTVLLLDRHGAVQHRIAGAARRDEVLAAIREVSAQAA